MRFTEQIMPNERAVLSALGYAGTAADAATQAAVRRAMDEVAKAAAPRHAEQAFALEEGLRLAGGGLVLSGHSIEAHLAGCTGCVLLAVTLGAGVDALLRTAGAEDVRFALLCDVAASVLAEQYAAKAERLLREGLAPQGLYATPRFSPGYGDFPLAAQAPLLRLLDAPRAIGLTVGEGGMLMPTKSVTAVVGTADHPVAGKLADCEGCTLDGKCERQKEGRRCGDGAV